MVADDSIDFKICRSILRDAHEIEIMITYHIVHLCIRSSTRASTFVRAEDFCTSAADIARSSVSWLRQSPLHHHWHLGSPAHDNTERE
jgi:hypothetical protein